MKKLDKIHSFSIKTNLWGDINVNVAYRNKFQTHKSVEMRVLLQIGLSNPSMRWEGDICCK